MVTDLAFRKKKSLGLMLNLLSVARTYQHYFLERHIGLILHIAQIYKTDGIDCNYLKFNISRGSCQQSTRRGIKVFETGAPWAFLVPWLHKRPSLTLVSLDVFLQVTKYVNTTISH